jgi:hypothetical protein
VDDDGEVITAVYWACFRAGFDDARYVYTLQQAIVQREHSADPVCLAGVREGRQALQETWDAIRVQPRYRNDRRGETPTRVRAAIEHRPQHFLTAESVGLRSSRSSVESAIPPSRSPRPDLRAACPTVTAFGS